MIENSTAIVSTSSPSIDVSGMIVFSCIMFGIAGVVGTLGNIMTLVTLAKYKPFQSAEILLFANLAVSDMVVTSIQDPFSIIAKTLGPAFFDTVRPLCVFVGSICTLSCVVSLLTIAAIGFTRYLLVCHNVRRGLSKKWTQCIILVCIYAWASLVIMMTFVGFGRHGFNHKTRMCLLVQDSTTGNFMIFFVVVCFWTPMLVTLLSYAKLYHCVRTTRLRIIALSKGGLTNKRRKQQAETIRLAKTAFIIFSIFACCWIPISMLFLTDRHGGVNPNISILFTTIAHMHPSLNFFIYYNTNPIFKKAVRKLMGLEKDLPVKDQTTVINTINTEF